MRALRCCVIVIIAGAASIDAGQAPAWQRGTIRGHVRVAGKAPGNPIIRMGMDPMCSRMNAGKRVVQEVVVASLDGSLANVFVSLQGSFPRTTVPTEPVTIDQRGCIYRPRVAGMRVGQSLLVRNGDALLHNVHGLSALGNGFNVSEPAAGVVQTFRPAKEEIMLHIRCDVHSWMTSYVGIVGHPYFAVTGGDGTFEIANVPAGTHTIQSWHERFGVLSQTVRVKGGATATVEFAFTGNEKPPAP